MEVPKLKKSHKIEVDTLLETYSSPEISKDQTEVIMLKLLSLEKKTRRDNDLDSSKRIASFALQLLISQKDWDGVCRITQLLCSRHAQLKQVVAQVVRLAMDTLSLSPDGAKLKLLNALREISKGRMHVELEFARMTRAFSHLKEGEGDLHAASEAMQQLSVESLSSMGYEEKFGFLLEQLRYALETDDMERAELTAAKFNVSWLEKKAKSEEAILRLKQKYYSLSQRFHLRKRSYLNVTKALLSLFDLETNSTSPTSLRLMRSAVLYICLELGSEEVYKTRREILKNRAKALGAEDMEGHRRLLKLLSEMKIVRWPFHTDFYEHILKDGILELSDDERKEDCASDGKERSFRDALKRSVADHNLLVISSHYEATTLGRVSDLTKLSESEAEHTICEMVTSGRMAALIDRPRKLIKFAKQKSLTSELDRWGCAISSVLEKVDEAFHLIQREKVLCGKPPK